MRDVKPVVTIADALRPKVLGSAFGDVPDDISYKISGLNDYFKGGRPVTLSRATRTRFLSRLLSISSFSRPWLKATRRQFKNILMSLRDVMDAEKSAKHCELTLTDCSPFYAGSTHLAWCASDAIIIPVRVDEHSIDSLELTLDMLDGGGSKSHKGREGFGITNVS